MQVKRPSREFVAGRGGGRKLLLAVAAPAEARAVLAATGGDRALADRPWCLHPLNELLELVVTGVGKANAAGGVGRIGDPERHSGVIGAGIAGALPGSSLELGQTVLATRSVFADEGLLTPSAFVSVEAMGFPADWAAGDLADADRALGDALDSLADGRGVLATVSTCSGTDQAAAEVVRRTGAVAESMEGAAVVLAAHRLGLPAVELRVISNTTGDRDRQRWDLGRALSRLADVIGRL